MRANSRLFIAPAGYIMTEDDGVILHIPGQSPQLLKVVSVEGLSLVLDITPAYIQGFVLSSRAPKAPIEHHTAYITYVTVAKAIEDQVRHISAFLNLCTSLVKDLPEGRNKSTMGQVVSRMASMCPEVDSVHMLGIMKGIVDDEDLLSEKYLVPIGTDGELVEDTVNQ